MQYRKKEYKKPELVEHGDLKAITQAKQVGPIDGDGPGHEDAS